MSRCFVCVRMCGYTQTAERTYGTANCIWRLAQFTAFVGLPCFVAWVRDSACAGGTIACDASYRIFTLWDVCWKRHAPLLVGGGNYRVAVVTQPALLVSCHMSLEWITVDPSCTAPTPGTVCTAYTASHPSTCTACTASQEPADSPEGGTRSQ